MSKMGVWDGEREVSLGKQKFDKNIPKQTG